VVLFRKHLSRYLEHLALGQGERQALLTASTASELLSLLGMLQSPPPLSWPLAAFQGAAAGA
jgi:hypothetical protein